MGLFNKKKKDTKEAVENKETQVELAEDQNDQEEVDVSDETKDQQESTNDVNQNTIRPQKQAFLRGQTDDYGLHMYFVIQDEDNYNDIKESMYRTHLKDTEVPYQLYTLKSTDDAAYSSGLNFLQFTMNYDVLNNIPFEIDEDFRTSLLSMLYFEIFEGSPLLDKEVVEATVYNGDDLLMNDESGEEEQVTVAPTLNIILNADTDEDLVINALSELYDQLAVYGYVVNKDETFNEVDEQEELDYSEFDDNMNAIFEMDKELENNNKTIPQFDAKGNLIQQDEPAQKLNPNNDEELNDDVTKQN